MDDEKKELHDCITLGTPSSGSQIKVFFDYENETTEQIQRKAEFVQDLFLQLKIREKRLTGA